jgi:hypothetical protein
MLTYWPDEPFYNLPREYYILFCCSPCVRSTVGTAGNRGSIKFILTLTLRESDGTQTENAEDVIALSPKNYRDIIWLK